MYRALPVFTGAETKEADSHMKEWTLEARLENIPDLTDQVNAALEELDCPMKAQIQIDVAIDELLSNIAKYAYAPGTGEVTVRLEEEPEPHAVRLSFLDSGMPFDPLAADEPDTALSADERSVGGLGIFLVRKTMDGVDYAYRDGQNVLSIRKLL